MTPFDHRFLLSEKNWSNVEEDEIKLESIDNNLKQLLNTSCAFDGICKSDCWVRSVRSDKYPEAKLINEWGPEVFNSQTIYVLVMPQSGSELRVNPEPLWIRPRFRSEFREMAEPNLMSGSVFRVLRDGAEPDWTRFGLNLFWAVWHSSTLLMWELLITNMTEYSTTTTLTTPHLQPDTKSLGLTLSQPGLDLVSSQVWIWLHIVQLWCRLCDYHTEGVAVSGRTTTTLTTSWQDDDLRMVNERKGTKMWAYIYLFLLFTPLQIRRDKTRRPLLLVSCPYICLAHFEHNNTSFVSVLLCSLPSCTLPEHDETPLGVFSCSAPFEHGKTPLEGVFLLLIVFLHLWVQQDTFT